MPPSLDQGAGSPMKFSPDIRALRRGLRLATKVAQSELGRAWQRPTRQPTLARTDEPASWGANPGQLRMLVHVPPAPVQPGRPLIVVLHGCGQQASAFAADSG